MAQFQVAEDFYDIEREANRLNDVLRELKNRKVVVENALHHIEKSMQVRPDIAREKILDPYAEMLGAFRDETLTRLTDVESFHSRLIENRIARLSQERLKLAAELGQVSTTITQTGAELNRKLAYLSDKRALDQYVAVSNERGE